MSQSAQLKTEPTPREEEQAAQRWAGDVNGDDLVGEWCYAVRRDMNLVPQVIDAAVG